MTFRGPEGLPPTAALPGGVFGASFPARQATPGPRVSIVAVEGTDALARWVPAWEELAMDAIEPNVFYEPWQILPAVEAFGAAIRLVHLLVFSAAADAPAGGPLLIAYFPLERRKARGLGMPEIALWKHVHCFLCTPLVRKGHAREALSAVLEWARTDPRGAAIIRFPQVAGDGSFATELAAQLRARRRPSFIHGDYERALFVPREDAGRYLVDSLPNKSRKQYRRLMRRLAEIGRLDFTALGPGGDLRGWVEDFLRLEASGWKGRMASALACRESERRFFLSMTAEAFRRGRLGMIAMNLNGRPIAMKCNLMADRGSFSFKIAFDESYERFSPGVLLEIENIRWLHETPGLQWMDSCAAPDHPMANRLWIDRRRIQTVSVATGRPLGDSLVRALPLMRWLAQRIPGRRSAGAAPATGESS